MGCGMAECQWCGWMETAEDVFGSDVEDLECGAAVDGLGGPYGCTRMKGHEGPHVACGNIDHAIAVEK